MANDRKQIISCQRITIWLAFFVIITGFLIGAQAVQAGVNHNLYGWAWNENFGWLSFNSSNTPGMINYGVNVDINGDFSGYAWSEQVGYVRFDTIGGQPGTAENPAGPVTMDPVTKIVTGWALICIDSSDPVNCTGIAGDQGWVSFRGTNYGVSLDGASNYFRGFAWSNKYGWISLNCIEGATGGGSICAISNYKVGKVTNVSGWAWNNYYGWFSFNCRDAGSYGCANFYGVNVDLVTKNLGGYAWNDNLGWMSFNETAPSYNFNLPANGNCAGCTAAAACSACYRQSDQKFYGWAKILALGDDGWVRLDDENGGTAPNYGVNFNPTINQFYGWAWNNSTNNNGIGWLSFNCLDQSVCGISNYHVDAVLNTPPTATNLQAPNWDGAQACSTLGAKGARLTWEFSDSDIGSSQSAYQCIVDTADDPGGSNIWDSAKVTGGLAQTTRACNVPGNLLGYDTDYYFWIQVWDDFDLGSGFIPYNRPAGDTPFSIDNGADRTFQTYAHEFPFPDFYYIPTSPSVGERVNFDSRARAKYFTLGSPSNPLDCDNDNCHWLWATSSTVLPLAAIASTTASTTDIIFNKMGAETVRLQVTDNDGYSCASTTQPMVKRKLPTWKETGGQ